MSSDNPGPAPGEAKVEGELDLTSGEAPNTAPWNRDGTTEDVVDDEGEGEVKTVGEPAIVADAPEQITEEWCGKIRRYLAAGDADLTGWNWSKNAVRHHATGGCAHDVDAPPVEYNHERREWTVADTDATDSGQEWVPAEEVDIETLERFDVDYEVRKQVRVIGGDDA